MLVSIIGYLQTISVVALYSQLCTQCIGMQRKNAKMQSVTERQKSTKADKYTKGWERHASELECVRLNNCLSQ